METPKMHYYPWLSPMHKGLKPTKRRRTVLALILLVIGLEYSRIPAFLHLTNPTVHITAFDETYIRTQTLPERPPTLSEVYPIVRPTNPEPPLPFTVPHILSVYIRQHTASAPVHDLFIYASGINLGKFSRNVSIIGCLVGKVSYPAIFSPYDVFKCTIPQPPAPGTPISLLFRNDEVLQQALTLKPITYGNLNITLPPGVIIDPPEDLKLMMDGSPEEITDIPMKMLASNFTWSTFPTEKIPMDEMISSPRYRACLMTMIKPYAESLTHWITYYRTLGVDKVYIMDNLSNRSIAEDFEGRKDVEVIYWPFETSQVQGFSFMLHALRARCEWVLSADIDEFVMTGIEGAGNVRPLAQFLKERASRNVAMSQFHYIEMVGNRTTAAKEPMPLAYTHLARDQIPNGKSACRTDLDWIWHFVHSCALHGAEGGKIEIEPGPMEPNHVSNLPRTVHYKVRSWEEYVTKSSLPGPSTNGFNTKADESFLQMSFPAWFGDLTKNAKEWTFFRDMYQVIMERYDENIQTLVWSKGERLCEFEENLSQGREGEVICSDMVGGSTRL